ncbi:MAG: hypothetical protein Q4A56_03250 [Porphyromonadaceae bacterium]|nr:hypothetical protein [Porphyromonadaceae bacterium]
MKKITEITLLILLSFIFIVCSNKSLDEKKYYSDDELLSALKFVGQGVNNFDLQENKLNSSPILRKDIISIKIIIGKKSKGCDDFGVCSVIIGPIVIYDNPKDIILTYNNKMFNSSHFQLFLSEKPNIDMTNVSLPIDEDIPVYYENDLITTIKAGNYKFNSNIGEHGGFDLKLSK